jgi:hypothetical protein
VEKIHEANDEEKTSEREGEGEIERERESEAQSSVPIISMIFMPRWKAARSFTCGKGTAGMGLLRNLQSGSAMTRISLGRQDSYGVLTYPILPSRWTPADGRQGKFASPSRCSPRRPMEKPTCQRDEVKSAKDYRASKLLIRKAPIEPIGIILRTSLLSSRTAKKENVLRIERKRVFNRTGESNPSRRIQYVRTHNVAATIFSNVRENGSKACKMRMPSGCETKVTKQQKNERKVVCHFLVLN